MFEFLVNASAEPIGGLDLQETNSNVDILTNNS
jgi:hypothetical protein